MAPPQRGFGLGLGGRRGCCRGTVAGLHDGFQRGALVAGIALHRLDQVGDEIMALLELNVDIGAGLVAAARQGHQPVVDRNSDEQNAGKNGKLDQSPSRHNRFLPMSQCLGS